MQDSLDSGDDQEITERYVPIGDEDMDKIEAPVLLIKKVFKSRKETIIQGVEEAFKEAGREDVKVVELYLTTNSTKDHAYLLLNSKTGTDLLLDGTVNVSVPVENDEGNSGSVVLWFDEADHLQPKEHQEPTVLFIRELPTNRPAGQVAQELRLRIKQWCPINDIDVPSDRNGKGTCTGTAKVYLDTEFDTRKCIYLLNHSLFLGQTILASFSNKDRQYSKPPKRISKEEDKLPVTIPSPKVEKKPKEKPSLDHIKFRSKKSEPKKLSPDKLSTPEERQISKKEEEWTVVKRK